MAAARRWEEKGTVTYRVRVFDLLLLLTLDQVLRLRPDGRRRLAGWLLRYSLTSTQWERMDDAERSRFCGHKALKR